MQIQAHTRETRMGKQANPKAKRQDNASKQKGKSNHKQANLKVTTGNHTTNRAKTGHKSENQRKAKAKQQQQLQRKNKAKHEQ